MLIEERYDQYKLEDMMLHRTVLVKPKEKQCDEVLNIAGLGMVILASVGGTKMVVSAVLAYIHASIHFYKRTSPWKPSYSPLLYCMYIE